jgi:hypothetical protein
MGNPEISPHCASPGIGGDSACPTGLPLRFAMMVYYLLWNYRSRVDATAAGAEVVRAGDLKER